MYRVLEVLVEEFRSKKPSAGYQLEQHKFCEIERAFMDSLTEEQKNTYLNLETARCKLQCIEFDDFAKYVFENLKKFF